MFIDIIFFLLMIVAIFKGYSRGFIVAVLSFAALIVGLAAAVKLSAVVAQKLRDSVNLNSYLLPVVSFALVFIAVALGIRWLAAIFKKFARLAFLGWADTFAGILLYAVMYVFAYSVILFYAAKIHLIPQSAINASVTYSLIAPFGPGVIEWCGSILPFFSNMFSALSGFFEGVAHKRSK